jgi:hypothetical protein
VLAQQARQASGRGLVLLPAGALLVHQLRYSLGYGSQASAALADQGHAYLGSLVPWIAVVAGFGLGCFVRHLARASHRGRDEARTRPFLRLWVTTTGGLIAIYALQELLEGFFAYGHPVGFAGVFGHGGWWALPAAALVALATVSLLRIGRTLAHLAARSRRAAPRRRTRTVPLPHPGVLLAVHRTPLAYAAAGRAPPVRRAG